uniref:RING-type domain-containing protein n=1 Tax=Alexandrium catenella TaxID=2925 RepID=A0A7S1L614_ALECA
MVDAGEVGVVSHGISKIVRALDNPSSTVRAAACDALAALGREGGGELLRRLRFIELADSMAGNEESRPLLEALTSLVHADAERSVRLAAARALQSIAEADGESARILRDRYSYRLVQVMCWSSTRRDSALADALAVVLGSQEEAEAADEAREDSEESEGDDPAEDCVICQRSLARHGEKRTLPCRHVFHRHCVNQWFAWSKRCWGIETCPLCRRQGHTSGKVTK